MIKRKKRLKKDKIFASKMQKCNLVQVIYKKNSEGVHKYYA